MPVLDGRDERAAEREACLGLAQSRGDATTAHFTPDGPGEGRLRGADQMFSNT
jgi:hypothetical protein